MIVSVDEESLWVNTIRNACCIVSVIKKVFQLAIWELKNGTSEDFYKLTCPRLSQESPMWFKKVKRNSW